MKKLAALFFIGLLSVYAFSDVLVAKGVVTSQADDKPVKGAIVTVTTGLTLASAKADTTDSTGAYSITTKTDSTVMGGTYVLMGVTATGYASGQYYTTVRNASDGKADTITHDFALRATGNPLPTPNDSVLVKGTVKKSSDSTALANATVTITLMGASSQPQTKATTNASGAYSVTIANTVQARSLQISASLTGYQTEQAFATINPTDAKKDTVTLNLFLDAVQMDTVTIKGKVIDSTTNGDIAGASVIVSYTLGFGGTIESDTFKTGTDGAFNSKLILDEMVTRVTWSISKTGYSTASENIRIPENNTIDLGVVKLVAFSTSDTIDYTVQGRILDQSGAGIGDAQVIVTVTQGTATVFTDTATSSNFGFVRGSYQVRFSKPYKTTDLTVKLAVTATGYNAGSATITVPSSTENITLNVTMQSKTAVSLKMIAKNTGVIDRIAVYTLDGKLVVLGTDLRSLMSALHPHMAGQSVLVRTWSKGTQMTKAMTVR